MSVGEWVVGGFLLALSLVLVGAAIYLGGRIVGSVQERCTLRTSIGPWEKNEYKAAAKDLKELATLAEDHLYVIGGGDRDFWGRRDVEEALRATRQGVRKLFVVPSYIKAEANHPLRQLEKKGIINNLRYCEDQLPQHFRLADSKHLTLEGLHPAGVKNEWLRRMRGTVYLGKRKEREFKNLLLSSHA